MRVSRRMKRMGRKKHHVVVMSLTALMDVFTNLVFFLLMSQGATVVDEPPKEIKLPDSYVDVKARPSVNILVSDREIAVEGEPTVSTAEVLAASDDLIPSIKDKLVLIKGASIGVNDASKEGNHEVTILAHNTIPFKVMKRIMTTCTVAGYSKISLAVRENSGVTAPPKRH